MNANRISHVVSILAAIQAKNQVEVDGRLGDAGLDPAALDDADLLPRLAQHAELDVNSLNNSGRKDLESLADQVQDQLDKFYDDEPNIAEIIGELTQLTEAINALLAPEPEVDPDPTAPRDSEDPMDAPAPAAVAAVAPAASETTGPTIVAPEEDDAEDLSALAPEDLEPIADADEEPSAEPPPAHRQESDLDGDLSDEVEVVDQAALAAAPPEAVPTDPPAPTRVQARTAVATEDVAEDGEVVVRPGQQPPLPENTTGVIPMGDLPGIVTALEAEDDDLDDEGIEMPGAGDEPEPAQTEPEPAEESDDLDDEGIAPAPAAPAIATPAPEPASDLDDDLDDEGIAPAPTVAATASPAPTTTAIPSDLDEDAEAVEAEVEGERAASAAAPTIPVVQTSTDREAGSLLTAEVVVDDEEEAPAPLPPAAPAAPTGVRLPPRPTPIVMPPPVPAPAPAPQPAVAPTPAAHETPPPAPEAEGWFQPDEDDVPVEPVQDGASAPVPPPVVLPRRPQPAPAPAPQPAASVGDEAEDTLAGREPEPAKPEDEQPSRMQRWASATWRFTRNAAALLLALTGGGLLIALLLAVIAGGIGAVGYSGKEAFDWWQSRPEEVAKAPAPVAPAPAPQPAPVVRTRGPAASTNPFAGAVQTRDRVYVTTASATWILHGCQADGDGVATSDGTSVPVKCLNGQRPGVYDADGECPKRERLY